jgi:hypothetical protein
MSDERRQTEIITFASSWIVSLSKSTQLAASRHLAIERCALAFKTYADLPRANVSTISRRIRAAWRRALGYSEVGTAFDWEPCPVVE